MENLKIVPNLLVSCDNSDSDLATMHNGENTTNNASFVEKEMGIHRRRIRSLHGRSRDYHGKSSLNTYDNLSTSTIFVSCLEISEENVIDTIMEGCTSLDEVIKKLKEQTISLTKKRCIKTKLTPVNQSKILQLSFIKKMQYRFSISLGKLKIGFRSFFYKYELWYSSLKVIEGKFGSSVATYFKFLRKLVILNTVIFLLNLFFLVLPQMLYTEFGEYNSDYVDNENRHVFNSKESYYQNEEASDNFQDETDNLFFLGSSINYQNNKLRLGNFFTGMGKLSHTVLFYGHYLNSTFTLGSGYYYSIPSAYFFSTAFCFLVVLCVLFFSVAESYKKCYIQTSSGIENVFAEKIFCAWDFGITKPVAEALKHSTIYMELKELLNESKNQKKNSCAIDGFHTLIIRSSLNLILLLLLIALGWYTYVYLDLNMDKADVPTVMMLMLILTLVATLSPVIFSWLTRIEYYGGPRVKLYATLIRTFIVHMLIIGIVVAHRLNSSSKIICWETVVGQDIYRLIVLDFIVGIADNMIEFIRYRLSRMWKKIEKPEFNIARNSLNLIYNQALLYIGLYFSPCLSLIVTFKMLLTFYLKKWGAMYNCQPSKKPWRAAQTETVFLGFAFLAFFGIMIAYGYIFTSVRSSTCGPFGGEKLIFQAILHEILKDAFDYAAIRLISQFFRTGVVVILLLLMVLAIYYLRTIISVRKRIIKNLRHIISEQASHKKKLLTKIHKTQADFKIGSKKHLDKRERLSEVNTTFHVFNEDDEFAGFDGISEILPLNRTSGNLLSNNNNRLCKSTFSLNHCHTDSSKMLKCFWSLQNLMHSCKHIGGDTDTKNSTLKNYARINKSTSDIHSAGVTAGHYKDQRNVTNIWGSNFEETQGGLELSELMPVIATNITHFGKRSYNHDERIASRINFANHKLGKT